jgi:hypothetical protein
MSKNVKRRNRKIVEVYLKAQQVKPENLGDFRAMVKNKRTIFDQLKDS